MYLVGPRDILGIYIQGVLEQSEGGLPPMQRASNSRLPPAIGQPVPVREDGTISLPFVPPIMAEGRSVADLEVIIRKAYTEEHQIIPPNRDRIIVTLIATADLQRPIDRQDRGTSAGGGAAGGITLGSTKHGMTYSVDLPAKRTTSCTPCSASGGLPGLDARMRSRFSAAGLWMRSRGKTSSSRCRFVQPLW